MSAKRALMMVKTDPPAGREDEWNRWYAATHIPRRLEIPGYLAARRFVRIEPAIPRLPVTDPPARYVTLYDMASINVFKGEAYGRLRDTEKAMPPDTFEVITARLPSIAVGVYEEIYSTVENYRPPASRFVSLMGHDVPRNRHHEFNAWYNTEHIPAIMRVPGFLTARRFKLATNKVNIIGGRLTVPQYIAIYDLESAEVMDSPALIKVSNTPWSAWVRSWYNRRLRMLGRRIYPED